MTDTNNNQSKDLNLDKAIEEVDKEHPKNDEDKGKVEEKSSKYWELALALWLVIMAVLVTLAGFYRRGETLLFFLRTVQPTIMPTPELLDKLSNGTELFLETDGERRRVIVQLPDRESWVLVSQDDFTAANPSLSPDGAWVAYLSTQDAPEIVNVPLEKPGKATYTSNELQGLGLRIGITMTSICPWTPIAWAEDSTRLAFFGCADDPPVSRAFTADLVTSSMTLQSSLVAGSVAYGHTPRQILWLDSDQVSVTFPPAAPGEPETVEIFSIPKR